MTMDMVSLRWVALRRPRLATVFAALLGLVAVGCGGGGSESTSPADQSAARAALGPPPTTLNEADFVQARDIYFNRCAGCHGLLRVGATGPNIEPKRAAEISPAGIVAMLTNGTQGGMPPSAARNSSHLRK